MKGNQRIFYPFLILLILNLFQQTNINAQTRVADSLINVIKNSKEDTCKVNTLVELAVYIGRKNLDTVCLLAEQALKLSQKIPWNKGEALSEFRLGRAYEQKQEWEKSFEHYKKSLTLCKALITSRSELEVRSAKKIMGKVLTNIGLIYNEKGDYSSALQYYVSGLKFIEETGEKDAAGNTLCNIGLVYKRQAEYPKALEYYLKGLKKFEELGNKAQIGMTICGIANIYAEQGSYQEALNYFLKALKLSEETGNKKLAGMTNGNIASLYAILKDYSKALSYQNKALELSKEAGDRQMIAITLGNIASLYAIKSDYNKALENYLEGVKIGELIGNKLIVAKLFGSIGGLYTQMGKNKEAEVYLINALSICKELGAENDEKDQHNYLFALYQKTNRPALALEHYKKYIALRDTIFSQENSKKLMRTEMDHEYEKKKAVADAEHKVLIENQKIVAAEKTKKQNIIIASVIGGLILVMIFAAFVFRSLRITNKQKLIIEQKNTETEHQKKEIEEKQKEILDSIRYAKRIQMAQIPTEKQVGKNLERLRKF